MLNSDFPTSPGVYLMKGAEGKILYIGKAKNLRARVSSYFSPEKDGRYQLKFLMRKVEDIECIVTTNEKEAFLLENTLIKKHQPRYNIFLKDDKTYLSLKLNIQHPFPRILITRKITKDGSLYFGPYTSALKAREMADFIEGYFHLRNCSEHEFANRVRPCLQYQINRCDAPCVGLISQEDYGQLVNQVKLFLQGRTEELIQKIKKEMEQASEELRFEEAARLRDLLEAVDVTLEKQQVIRHFGKDIDALGFYREAEQVSIAVLISRGGALLERKTYFFKTPQEDEDLLESFLLQYYSDVSLIPREILLPFSLEKKKTLQEILTERKAASIQLKLPKKGEKVQKLKLAKQNAQENLRRKVLTEESREEILNHLQTKLELQHFPRRIECYDISNLQGQMAVGSCVSFLEGLPDKSSYRRFKIKTVKGANDFAMLYEVLMRRLSHPDWPLPDLILIDGGKGQLSAAHAALQDKNVLNVDLVSLAKEKNGKPERVFLLGRKNPLTFSAHSSELHLLMRLRDEAHRFGITYHRQLRNRQFFD